MSAAENNVITLPSRSDDLIPDGVYQVALARYQLMTRFNRGSLEMWFKVLDYGEHFGKLVPRYYKVELLREGKKKNARSFRASRHSAFSREFDSVFGRAAPAGVAAVNCYRDVPIEASIRRATSDHKQRALSERLQYNVIDALIRRSER